MKVADTAVVTATPVAPAGVQAVTAGGVTSAGGAAAVVNDHVTGGVMFPAASRAPVMVTL